MQPVGGFRCVPRRDRRQCPRGRAPRPCQGLPPIRQTWQSCTWIPFPDAIRRTRRDNSWPTARRAAPSRRHSGGGPVRQPPHAATRSPVRTAKAIDLAIGNPARVNLPPLPRHSSGLARRSYSKFSGPVVAGLWPGTVYGRQALGSRAPETAMPGPLPRDFSQICRTPNLHGGLPCTRQRSISIEPGQMS